MVDKERPPEKVLSSSLFEKGAAFSNFLNASPKVTRLVLGVAVNGEATGVDWAPDDEDEVEDVDFDEELSLRK